MSIAINNSTPDIKLTGIKDESGRIVQDTEVSLPQHLPLILSFAEKGDENGEVLTPSQLFSKHGIRTTDPLEQYGTHVTELLRGLLEQGNQVLFKRLRPTDAADPAWLRLSVGITKAPITEKRMVLDESTQLEVEQEVPTGVNGYIIRWMTSTPEASKAALNRLSETDRQILTRSMSFGQGLTVAQLGLIDDDEVSTLAAGPVAVGQSQERIYPIFDLRVNSFGSWGNNQGIRISAPNETSRQQPDLRFYEATLARPFRIQFVSRKDARQAARTVANRYGELSVDLSFKPGAVNPLAGNDDVYIGTTLIESFENLDPINPVRSPFSDIKIYNENIEHIVKTIYKAELEQDEKVPYGELPSSPKGRRLTPVTDESIEEPWWQIDFMTGRAMNGNLYRTVRVVDVRNQGATLDETTEHWAKGGTDGTMGNKSYNALVSDFMAELSNPGNPFNELAKYPYSHFYDTGFPFDMKEELLTPMRLRKDVMVTLSTHSVDKEDTGNHGVIPLTPSVEAGVVRALGSIVTAYPESEIYGTKACRANIIMQAGKLINSNYKGYLPVTYELAMKRAHFMGASDGRYKIGQGYDQDGLKQTRFMKDITNAFIPFTQRERNWTRGASWLQNYDAKRTFFPAVRTVYSDETSVLTSDINVNICAYLEKVCFFVWRRLVGSSKMTKKQLIEKSDKMILEYVEGIFDGRAVIKPRTYFTDGDDQRGYSWHCEIHAHLNNMRTVKVATIVTHRMEDLEGGN